MCDAGRRACDPARLPFSNNHVNFKNRKGLIERVSSIILSWNTLCMELEPAKTTRTVPELGANHRYFNKIFPIERSNIASAALPQAGCDLKLV